MIRNVEGRWLCGFSKFIGNSSAYVAELWGDFEGLKLVRDRGFSKVELQIDSLVVAKSILGEGCGSSKGWSLMKQIKHLL